MSRCKKKLTSSGDARQNNCGIPNLVGGTSCTAELDRLVIELAKALGRMAAQEDYRLSKTSDKIPAVSQVGRLSDRKRRGKVVLS